MIDLINDYKKLIIGDENRFNYLSDKSTNRGLKELEEKIKSLANKNNIKINETELNDLCLEFFDIRFSDEEQFFEEIVNPEKKEENITLAINQVLKKKYNVSYTSPQNNHTIESNIPSTFGYSMPEIEKYLDSLKSFTSKFDHLLSLRKKLSRLIYSFENSILNKYSDERMHYVFEKASTLSTFILDLKQITESEYCEELNKIISPVYKSAEDYFKKTSYYNDFFIKEFDLDLIYKDDDIYFAVRSFKEELGNGLREFKLSKNYVTTEIDYLLQQKKYSDVAENEELSDVEELSDDEEIKAEKQRDKIRKYLLEHYPDINSNYLLNLSAISLEITNHIYPNLKSYEAKKKKNVIRQELLLFKSGKLKLEIE